MFSAYTQSFVDNRLNRVWWFDHVTHPKNIKYYFVWKKRLYVKLPAEKIRGTNKSWNHSGVFDFPSHIKKKWITVIIHIVGNIYWPGINVSWFLGANILYINITHCLTQLIIRKSQTLPNLFGCDLGLLREGVTKSDFIEYRPA